MSPADEFVKLREDVEPKAMSDAALVYDHATIHYRVSRIDRGLSYKDWPRERLAALHRRLEAELMRRDIPHVGPLGQFKKGEELPLAPEEGFPLACQDFLDGTIPETPGEAALGDALIAAVTRPQYAIVNPSGNIRGPEVKLSDVLPKLKPFMIRSPFVWIVGGLAIHGKTRGDVDILIRAGKDEFAPKLQKVLTWRILRALPPEIADRVQFHYDEFHGPFTDAVPVYDLVVGETQGHELVRMDAKVPANPEPDADISKAASIRPGRYFPTAKPVMGADEKERLTIDSLVRKTTELDSWPVLVQKKYDGVSVILSKEGDRATIFSEDGKNITDRKTLGEILAALKALKFRSLVMPAELELWRGREHLPRDHTSGLITADDPVPAGLRLLANVHDVLYLDGDDYSNQGTSERLSTLRGLELKGHPWRVVESAVARNSAELASAARRMSKLPGSEGCIVKPSAQPYPIRGRKGWIKFRKNAVITAVVYRRVETKGGAYVYRFALKPSREFPAPESETVTVGDEKLVYSGKTFAIADKYRPGARIPIEFSMGNLNRLEDDTFTFTAVLPRPLDPKDWPKSADTIAEAVTKARSAGILVERSPEGVREARKDERGHFVFKARDPFTNPPPEGKPYPYVVQEHARGKSLHADLRIGYERGETLLGWTLATQIRGSIKEPVESLAQLRALKADYSKINWKAGTWAKRRKPGTTPLVNVEIYANRKALEPWAWLRVEGTVEPGEVGATKNFPGVFRIVDRGTVEYGAVKPWLWEGFFKPSDGRGIGERIIFRQLKGALLRRKMCSIEEVEYAAVQAFFQRLEERLRQEEFRGLTEDSWCWDHETNELYVHFYNEEMGKAGLVVPAEEGAFAPGEPVWLAIRPVDQTPYVLSRRAVNEKWVPPQGFSALPRAMRVRVPEKLRYWTATDARKRLALRDELFEAMKRDEVKLIVKASSPARFVYHYHTFRKRGEKPVRAGPTSWKWQLRLAVPGEATLRHWTLTQDLIENKWVAASFRRDRDKKNMRAEGEFPPGTPSWNPTKETDARAEIVDKGDVTVLIDQPDLLKVRLQGRKLRGYYLFTRREAEWSIRRVTAAPTP